MTSFDVDFKLVPFFLFFFFWFFLFFLFLKLVPRYQSYFHAGCLLNGLKVQSSKGKLDQMAALLTDCKTLLGK